MDTKIQEALGKIENILHEVFAVLESDEIAEVVPPVEPAAPIAPETDAPQAA